MTFIEYIGLKKQAKIAAWELVKQAHLRKGQIVLVGCSSSEVMGYRIGKNSNFRAAMAVYEGIKSVLDSKGIYLATQCCEHLNRSVIVEEEALLPGTEIVNVVPQPKAGGSFATLAYKKAKHPVAVEAGVIRADAGLDIGDTFIGMQLKPVVVPVRLGVKQIGYAHLTAARTRPKFVGGERAVYDMKLAGGEIKR